MASLRDFFKLALSGYSLPEPEEDELLTWQKDVCMKLGVPWPPPKAKAGKPNRQALWLRAIYAEVRVGRSLPDGVKTAFDFPLMHLKRRSVMWAEKLTLDIQNRTDLRNSAWKHVSWESDEDFARLVTQAQVMHDANQLFISHADLPADAPAAGCDTIDEQTIFDLDEEEEPEEEDEGAAAPSSCSVVPPTGAAIKHKRTKDKFLALRIVHGKGPTLLVGSR